VLLSFPMAEAYDGTGTHPNTKCSSSGSKEPESSRNSMSISSWTDRYPAVSYIAPFLAFVGVMAIEKLIDLPPQVLYTVRFTLVLILTLLLSSRVLSFRPSQPVQSILLGLAVFL